MTSVPEWMADLGKAAEELGYGIVRVEPRRIDLVGRQDDVEITIESVFLSGDFLRGRLVPIPHRSGSSYTRDYMETTPRA